MVNEPCEMNQQLSSRLGWRIVAFLFVTLNSLYAQVPPRASAITVYGSDAIKLNREKVTYGFKLLPNGGAIEITSNDPSDVATRDAVRQHVAKIATMLEEGNFSIGPPINDQKTPGVDTMQRLKGRLYYAPENLPNGGRVQITTENSEALKAIHEFVRFQIQEHKRGESLPEPLPAKRKHPANNLGHDARPASP